MKKYRVNISFNEMIIEAEDEEDAQSQAVDLADFGNADINVENFNKLQATGSKLDS